MNKKIKHIKLKLRPGVYSQREVSWLMFSKRMLSVCKSWTHTYRPDFCRSMLRKNANMFFSKKKLRRENDVSVIIANLWNVETFKIEGETHSKTELSFWSPQMRISVMERIVSTSRFLLWSVTVVFFVRTWYMYLKSKIITILHKWYISHYEHSVYIYNLLEINNHRCFLHTRKYCKWHI